MPNDLTTIWQTSLPGCGYNITSIIISGKYVYAASSGYVYQLDPMTGAVLNTNGLSGLGKNEVRMMMSSDGSVLLIGTNGYAVGLNPANLNTIWQTSLPGCGYNIVSVEAGVGVSYFASNGCVYALNQGSGAVQYTNGLSGMGSHEVRLALSDDLSVLYAGTNGYALGLSSQNLNTQWSTSLPGCGYNVVSLESGEGVGYFASNGYVYRVDEKSGGVLQTNSLSGMGNHEVRLALAQEGDELFVGTNGYALGLNPSTLATVWQTSLPGCGYNIVTPLAGDEVVYLGSNGYVYEVNASNGNVNVTNGLSGIGRNEVRLATNEDNELVWVGTDGYAVGLSLPEYPSVDGPWMSQMQSIIGPKMLRQIAIPGTHDSGTYAITPLSAIGADMPSWLGYIQVLLDILGTRVMQNVMANWGVAQGENFLQQLQGGIRYLDLRVQSSGGNLNFVHGLVSAPVSDLVSQLVDFYNDSQYANEVVILDFNHFYNMSSADFDTLANMLNTSLGNKLVPNTTGVNVTLNQLWATSGRIIVFFDDAASVQKHNFLWSESGISSPWPNVTTSSALHTALNGELPNTSSGFFVLQGLLTPDGTVISQGLIPFSGNPDSLLSQAEGLNPQLNSWINSDWSQSNLNIVICDWYQSTNFVDIVVGLNNPGAGLHTAGRALKSLDLPAAAESSVKAFRRMAPNPAPEVCAHLTQSLQAAEKESDCATAMS
jgi:hypothetical protein